MAAAIGKTSGTWYNKRKTLLFQEKDMLMDKTPLSRQLRSIPNLLSCFRIVLIPLFVWRYVTAQQPGHLYAAAGIVALSGLTDLLDGLIARRFGMVTQLGKALDPLADKLTQCALLVCLLTRHPLIKWLVVLFFVKEISVTALSAVLYRRGKVLDGAKWFGKVSTAVFYAVALALTVFPGLPRSAAGALIGASAAMMLIAFAGYGRLLVRMYYGKVQQ